MYKNKKGRKYYAAFFYFCFVFIFINTLAYGLILWYDKKNKGGEK